VPLASRVRSQDPRALVCCTIEGLQNLLQDGFEYVTDFQGQKFSRSESEDNEIIWI